jgi:sulfopyruvate decarboxylase subunit beta
MASAAKAAIRTVFDQEAAPLEAGMKTNDAMKVLATHRSGAVVVCALGTAANGWWAVTRSEESFYMHGAMGFAASFALGLAAAIPHAPVWVLNSDGSLCMNLGCLLTEAGQQPKNLKHFVVDNQCYQTVSNMPMVNRDGADYAAIARGAGIARAILIDNAEELDRRMPEINAAPGPYFVHLRVEAEENYQRPPPFSYEGPEMKYRFGRAMEKKFGIEVFGPTGF